MQMRLRILINGNWVDLTPEDAVTLHHDLGRALHVGLAPEPPRDAEPRRGYAPVVQARNAADARPSATDAPPLTDPAWQTSLPHVVGLDPPTVTNDPVGRVRPTGRKATRR